MKKMFGLFAALALILMTGCCTDSTTRPTDETAATRFANPIKNSAAMPGTRSYGIASLNVVGDAEIPPMDQPLHAEVVYNNRSTMPLIVSINVGEGATYKFAPGQTSRIELLIPANQEDVELLTYAAEDYTLLSTTVIKRNERGLGFSSTYKAFYDTFGQPESASYRPAEIIGTIDSRPSSYPSHPYPSYPYPNNRDRWDSQGYDGDRVVYRDYRDDGYYPDRYHDRRGGDHTYRRYPSDPRQHPDHWRVVRARKSNGSGYNRTIGSSTSDRSSGGPRVVFGR